MCLFFLRSSQNMGQLAGQQFPKKNQKLKHVQDKPDVCSSQFFFIITSFTFVQSASNTISLNEAVSVSLSSCVKPESPGDAREEVMEDVIAPESTGPTFKGKSRMGFTFSSE